MTEQVTPYLSMVEDEPAPEWNVRCRIHNEPVGWLESGRVSYDKDGSSDLEFTVYDDAYWEKRAKTRRCDVWVQKGARARWHYVFSGEVMHAKTSDTGLTKIEAFGPRSIMARRFFNKKVTYLNMPLRNFVASIRDRMNERGSVFDIQVGTDFLVENEPFSGQTSLLEGFDKVLGAAFYVGVDRPDMNVLIMPKPRPGLRRVAGFGNLIEIGPLDYNSKALDIPENPDGPYAQVIAYKNDDDSEEIWRESATVPQREGAQVDENQIFWLDDFPGEPTNAARQVYLIAQALEFGAYQPKVKELPFEEPFFTHDPVDLIERRENVNDTEIKRGAITRYATTVIGSQLDLIKATYELELDGVKVSSRATSSNERYETAGPYVIDTTAAMVTGA